MDDVPEDDARRYPLASTHTCTHTRTYTHTHTPLLVETLTLLGPEDISWALAQAGNLVSSVSFAAFSLGPASAPLCTQITEEVFCPEL